LIQIPVPIALSFVIQLVPLPLVRVLVGNQIHAWFRVRILVPVVVLVVRFEILVPAMVEVRCEILVPAMVGVRCEILVRTFWSVRVLEGMELKIEEEKRKFRSDQIGRVFCEAEPMLKEEENRKRKLFFFFQYSLFYILSIYLFIYLFKEFTFSIIGFV
jgi:hypothetical protein